MLLSIPAILAAGSGATLKIYEDDTLNLLPDAILAGAIAFAAAFVALVLMMGWLKRASFTPFVIYRILLGVGILAWVYL